jgi:hypothetical protein
MCLQTFLLERVLKPEPKADQFEGESTIYVDDFEGSQSTIDMFSLAWSLHPR